MQTQLEMIVLYGEPTEAERQHALEAWTAYRLGLTSISTLRQLKPSALTEAKERFNDAAKQNSNIDNRC